MIVAARANTAHRITHSLFIAPQSMAIPKQFPAVACLLTLIFLAASLCSSFAADPDLDHRIRTHRMSTFVIEAAPNSEVRVQQLRHEFWFGAALANQMFDSRGDSATARKYKEVFLENFNSAVTENALKWHSMEREKGKIDYSVVDQMLEWCDQHKIPLRGHNIFWGISQFVQPWLKELNDDQLHAALKNRAIDVARRYKGRFAEYDFNNEMIHGNWYAERLGPDITAEMVNWIRQEDPAAVLYLNDYDILTGRRLDDYITHIREFQEQAIRFDGIGVQGHLHGDTFDAVALQNALDQLARFQLPIRITEFNFPGQRSKYYEKRVTQLSSEEEQAKAKALTDYYRICFAHPSVDGILMWGFWEGANWIPVSSLFRRDWSPTPAAEAYRNLLFKEWWTDSRIKTDAHGRAEVRAFHGQYRLSTGNNVILTDLKKSEAIKRVVVQ